MGGEERSGAAEERDGGGGLLVGQVLGVGQAGEPVHGGVQVDVSGSSAAGLGAPSGDPLRSPVRLSVGVQVAAPVDLEAFEPAAHGARRDPVAFTRELERDPGCRPLVLAAQRLDPVRDLGRGLRGRGVRDAGPVMQAGLAQAVEPVLPLRQAGARDTGLGSDMSDRTPLVPPDQA